MRKYGPIGMTFAAPTPSSIALIDRPFSSCSRQISAMPEFRMRLTTKPGTSRAGDRLLLDRLGEVQRGGDGLLGGVVALDDLDQRHDRGRVEVVEADDLVGPLVASPISVIDSDDVFEARIAWPGVTASSSAKTACLMSMRSGHGLDHEVDVAEARVVGRAVDAPDDLVDLRAACSSLSLPFLTSWRPALRDAARLVEARLHELLLDVLEDDGDAGGGDGLGDLAAHRSCADDGGLEDEHAGRRLTVCLREAAEVIRLVRPARGRPARGEAVHVPASDSFWARRTKSRSTSPSRPLLLELVLELERDGDVVAAGREDQLLPRICSSSTAAVWPVRAS